MDTSNPETVIIKPSRFGKGIFATSDFSAGTTLLKITGKPLSFEDTLKLGDKECYSLQIGIDKYIIPDGPFGFSNHSCDPNCGITGNMEFITLRKVAKGEELLWDYSTSMMERSWTMECGCNSVNCRNIIGDFDCLPINLQDKYRQMQIVLPYIIKEIKVVPALLEFEHSL